MSTARTPMTSRELDDAAGEIACELLLIAFAIHGRTRLALAAAYAAVACSDAFEPGPGDLPAGRNMPGRTPLERGADHG